MGAAKPFGKGLHRNDQIMPRIFGLISVKGHPAVDHIPQCRQGGVCCDHRVYAPQYAFVGGFLFRRGHARHNQYQHQEHRKRGELSAQCPCFHTPCPILNSSRPDPGLYGPRCEQNISCQNPGGASVFWFGAATGSQRCSLSRSGRCEGFTHPTPLGEVGETAQVRLRRRGFHGVRATKTPETVRSGAK